MIIDGVAASEAIDSSGEILELEGMDISDLKNGVGILNYEHRGDQSPGASPLDILGSITYAHKIFKREDCEDDRQRKFWEQVRLPFLYIKAELFDDEGHPGAIAAAAMIRYYQRRGQPIIARYSIEGTTLEKKDNVLKQSIARKVALTVKPCNRTAISGVVEDPHTTDAEQSKLKDPLSTIVAEDAKKFQREDGWGKLSTVELETDIVLDPSSKDDLKLTIEGAVHTLRRLNKTLSAGMPSGAPGTLIGGAALQRGDISERAKRILATAKAALRDYDPVMHKSFRDFLKMKLPEVSDTFLDRFSDLVDGLKIKQPVLAKKGEDAPIEKPLGTKQPKLFPEMEVEPAPSETKPFKLARYRDKSKFTSFDEKNGEVVSPQGERFKVYIPAPDDKKYNAALNDPWVNEIHGRAMDNWHQLHRLAREGRLPHEVFAHAAMFSALSPNTAVPIQELAFGFVQDLMDKQGFDPLKQQDPEQTKHWTDEFNKMAYGYGLPEYMRDHFANDPNIRLMGDQRPQPGKGIPPHFSEEQGKWLENEPKKAGQRHNIGLSKEKMARVLEYHKIHNIWYKLFTDAKGDGRKVSGQLNEIKAEATRAKTAQYAAKRKGTEAKPREYTEITGFAPKTIRYAMGMAGAGNVLVPDTHFIRHIFGFPFGDPKNARLKNILWEEKNEPILQGLDRFYYQHHPVVPYVQRLAKQRYGEDLGENALFPAFWLHWLTIQLHDRARNWTSMAHNQGTDHDVYFHRARQLLNKYGIPSSSNLAKTEGLNTHDASLACRAAHAVRLMDNQFGAAGSQLFYYAFVVPALLGLPQRIAKTERATNLAQDLKKAQEEGSREEEPIKFKNHMVKPGQVEMLGDYGDIKAGEKLKLLFANPTFHYAQREGASKPIRLLSEQEGTQFRVTKPHEVKHMYGIVHVAHHGVPHLSESPEQTAMLEGLDLNNDILEYSGRTYLDSPAGYQVFVKRDFESGFNPNDLMRQGKGSRNEGAFHAVARDIFGLGQHVPVTAAIHHPDLGHYSVQTMIPDGEHYDEIKHVPLIMRLGHEGTLDKLAMMDMILDQRDRHGLNYMYTPGRAPFIHLIDNELSLEGNPRHVPSIPHYWRHYQKLFGGPNGEMSPEAIKWIKGLNPIALENKLRTIGINPEEAGESVRRLKALQTRVVRGGPISRSVAYMSPFTEGAGPKYNSWG